MPPTTRTPRPARTSTPLPRFDRIAAATLAVGATASALAGCHKEPLCVTVAHGDDGAPSSASWWSRLAAPIACNAGPGGFGPVAGYPPPPGAMPVATPVPPPAIPPLPNPPLITGGAAVEVTPTPLEHPTHGAHHAPRRAR